MFTIESGIHKRGSLARRGRRSVKPNSTVYFIVYKKGNKKLYFAYSYLHQIDAISVETKLRSSLQREHDYIVALSRLIDFNFKDDKQMTIPVHFKE